MYVISKQQNKKILVVRLYQNAKTHVLCYNADLLSSPSPNPQGLASTKTQLVQLVQLVQGERWRQTDAPALYGHL